MHSRPRSILSSSILPALILALGSHALQARELALPAEDLVAAELAMVGIEPMTGTPVVVLRAPDSGAVVPIFIGPNEAQAILMAQRNVETPRPMTHDLAASLFDALGGELRRVIVDELRDNTYFGALELTVSGRDEPVLVDSRPSDALALAVRTGAEIWVAPAVLESAQDIPFEGLGDDAVVTALGITVVEPSAELRRALELPDRDGVLVSDSRGMASIAGVHPGALILKVNGESVATPSEFLERVGHIPRDENARIEFWQGGETREATVPVDVPEPRGRRHRRGAI